MDELKRVSWTRRSFAYLIDSIIVELFWFLFVIIVSMFTTVDVLEFPDNDVDNLFWVEVNVPVAEATEIADIASTYVMMFPLRFLYWIFYEYRRGKTIGKSMLKVKTVKVDGSNQSFIDIIILTVFKTSPLLIFDVVLGIIFMRGSKERISNRLTNTVVVSD